MFIMLLGGTAAQWTDIDKSYRTRVRWADTV